MCDFEINKIFIDNFLSDIITFSTQKYSSNIIEKCMDCCDEITRELIIQKYCKEEIVQKLLFDMYGNYVLQKVMQLSKEPLTSKYISIIGPLLNGLSSYPFGARLLNKLVTSFPSLNNYLDNKNEQSILRKGKYKKKHTKNNYNFNELANKTNQNNYNNLFNNFQMVNNPQNNINNQIYNNNFPNTNPLFPINVNSNCIFPFQLGNNKSNLNNNGFIVLGNEYQNNFGNNMINFSQFNSPNNGNSNYLEGDNVMINYNSFQK